MKCPHCGGNNFKWAKRCDHCGRALTDATTAPAAAAQGGPRIQTPAGASIQLTPATAQHVDLLRTCWPMGIQTPTATTGQHGLVCRDGARELMVVKFQQVDVPTAAAPLVRFQNRALIALALPGYLQRGHRGFIMPCAYLKPKADDRAETGIAYLVGSHPEFTSVSTELPDNRWDAPLGAGATAMIGDFAREVGRVIDDAPQGMSAAGVSLGRPVFLTMEVRPVSAVGVLEPRVAVLGPDVLVTMPNPETNFDSSWDFAVRAGLRSAAHLPVTLVEKP